MTKTTAERRLGRAAAVLLLFCAAAASAAPAPPSPGGRLAEYEASQRLFGRTGRFEPLGELTERWQYTDQRLSRSLMLGSYTRVERRLKLGAFYRLQFGARHDDDWERDRRGRWSWRDTMDRPEHLLVLDATPRATLPGGAWVASLKVRFERNFSQRESLLRVQPEVAWFWMNGLTPKATVFLRQETDFALDFGETDVWQRWYYLAALWHASPRLSLGPSVALRDEVWSTSGSYRSISPASPGYQTLYRAWVLGFTAIYRLR